MPRGHLAIVLHTHLPWVRHPEHPRALEERWLFEAITESYVPLVTAFDRLAADRVPFALSMSLTPPVVAMLRDDMLRRRYHEHLARIEGLAAREAARLEHDERFGPVARFYVDHLAAVRRKWDELSGDVVGALLAHADAGRIDLLACSATHAYLPGLLPTRRSLRAQLAIGVRAFERATGRKAAGLWLPECAYSPEFDADLAAAGVRYTLVDTHGIALARPRPPFGVHAPIASPSGVVFFGRDVDSSRQVWSRHEGYPGDAYYRDFYRDVGFDLPTDLLGEEIGPFGVRLMTGLKYFRITGAGDAKEPYQPGIAAERTAAHAEHFLAKRVAQVEALAASMPVAPIVVAPYDTELFGHWWFEGPVFLEALFRKLAHAHAAGDDTLAATTLGGYLAANPVVVRATPSASSWGAGGYGRVWVGDDAASLWRHVHHASRYVEWLVARYRDAGGERGRALDMAIRQLLLLQSSDWAFILTTGTVRDYALARVRAHVHRLRHLGWLVEKPALEADDVAFLDDLGDRDSFLGEMSGGDLRSPYL